MATPPKKRASRAKPKAELEVAADAPVKVASERVDRAPGAELAVRAEAPLAAGRLGATLPTHQIQTTMRPDVTITVPDDEYQELLAMGLVYSGTPQSPVADGNDLMIADKVQNGISTPAALRAALVAVKGGLTEQLAGRVQLPSPPALSLVKVGRIRSAGAAGAPDAALVESPAVYDDPQTGRVFMLYAGYSQASGRDGNMAAAQHGSLMIAWSTDGGLTFGAGSQLIGGSGSGPDADGSTGAKAVFDGTVWHIFYVGLATSGYEGTPSLCYATTPSMASPSITRHGQIIGASGTGWRSGRVYTCSTPVQVGGTWYIFVNAAQVTTDFERIGVFTASSLAGPWTAGNGDAPVLAGGSSGAWDEKIVGDPGVFFDGQLWWMSYYGASADFSQVSDSWAYTTPDLFPLGWTKHPAGPILPVGPSGSFDQSSAAKPFIYRGNGVHRHYYTADDGTHRSIALAVPADTLPAANWARRISPATPTYSIGSTSWVEVDPANLRITLPAQVGQTLRVNVSGVWGNAATDVFLDAVILGSSLFMGQETTADSNGMAGCFRAGANNTYGGFSDRASHVLTAADISNGQVTVSLFGKAVTPDRELLSTATTRVNFEAEVFGRPH